MLYTRRLFHVIDPPKFPSRCTSPRQWSILAPHVAWTKICFQLQYKYITCCLMHTQKDIHNKIRTYYTHAYIIIVICVWVCVESHIRCFFRGLAFNAKFPRLERGKFSNHIQVIRTPISTLLLPLFDKKYYNFSVFFPLYKREGIRMNNLLNEKYGIQEKYSPP